jgi:hypothetical protein
MIKLTNILKHILKEQEEIAQDPFLGAPEEPAPTPEEASGIVGTDTAKKLIFDTKGKFFTVTFIKKDGTERTMNARLQVKKYLKGGELKYSPSEMGYIPVYDMQSKGYRMVNTNTIKTLKIGKKIYTIPSAIAEGKEEHELIYEVYSSDFKVGDKVKFNPEAMKKMGFENPIDYYKDLTGIIAEIYHYDIMSNGIPTDVLYIDLNKPIQPPGGYVGNTEEESERGMNELTLVKSEGDFNMITKI